MKRHILRSLVGVPLLAIALAVPIHIQDARAMDLALNNRVVSLAVSQVGQTQGIGEFSGVIWADAQWTYCERFVGSVVTRAQGTDLTHPRYPSAIDDYYAHSSILKSGDPPRGAIVYYGTAAINGFLGHVGVSDGSGSLISVYTKTTGVAIRPLDSMGAVRLGWILPEEY